MAALIETKKEFKAIIELNKEELKYLKDFLQNNPRPDNPESEIEYGIRVVIWSACDAAIAFDVK